MKHFFYGTFREFLAVNKRLEHKHIREDGGCRICNLGEESIRHALFECSQANRIWRERKFKGIIDEIPVEAPRKLLKWVFETVGLEKMEKFISIASAIWTRTNQKVVGRKEMNTQILVHSFLKMLGVYHIYASHVLDAPMAKSPLSFDKRYPLP